MHPDFILLNARIATMDATHTEAGALAALNEGAISAEELTRAHVAAVEALNPKLNAFITTTSDQALDAARASDARRARGEAGREYALEHYDRAALAQRFVSLVDDLVAGSR